MFSRFLGKGKTPSDAPPKEAAQRPGVEVIEEDDPETAWGLWDSALAEQESRLHETPEPEGESRDTVPLPLPEPEPVDEGPPTEHMPRAPLHGRDEALQIVEMHHARIAATIRNLWGHKECSDYIYQLIMNGNDGMGKARMGFNQQAAEAMLILADLHEAEFGSTAKEDHFGFGASRRGGTR